jgi:hypothetical protein
MDVQLDRPHQQTYDAIFDHPDRRDVAWQDVRSMLGGMPGISQQQFGAIVRLTRNGWSHVLHESPVHPIVDARGLGDLRRFLQESRWPRPQEMVREGPHLLVVVHHRVARIYRIALRESLPEQLIPYDRTGFGRHLHHAELNGSGRRTPDQDDFHQAVAATLQGAERILLFGSGPGASGAVAQLFDALRRSHQDLSDRVTGWIVVDEGHLTESRLLADSRAYYASCQHTQEASYPC